MRQRERLKRLRFFVMVYLRPAQCRLHERHQQESHQYCLQHIVIIKFERKYMATRTFEEIMGDLFLMKEDLLRLHYAYSPEAANYHQVRQIDTLKDQVRLAQEKLNAFQIQFQANRQAEVNQQRNLEAENNELLTINEQLVASNEKFKALLETSQRQKEDMQRQLGEEREGRRISEGKHQKEVENLKLMQAQELYMLRKKEKKAI